MTALHGSLHKLHITITDIIYFLLSSHLHIIYFSQPQNSLIIPRQISQNLFNLHIDKVLAFSFLDLWHEHLQNPILHFCLRLLQADIVGQNNTSVVAALAPGDPIVLLRLLAVFAFDDECSILNAHLNLFFAQARHVEPQLIRLLVFQDIVRDSKVLHKVPIGSRREKIFEQAVDIVHHLRQSSTRGEWIPYV